MAAASEREWMVTHGSRSNERSGSTQILNKNLNNLILILLKLNRLNFYYVIRWWSNFDRDLVEI